MRLYERSRDLLAEPRPAHRRIRLHDAEMAATVDRLDERGAALEMRQATLPESAALPLD